MNKKQKKVIKAKYKDNCYILVSGYKREEQFDSYLMIEYVTSFLYDAGNVAAEWEMEHGPIQIWYKCEENDEGAEEHYYYDFHNSPILSWSQLAVERYQLKESFIRGDFDYIFNVLKDWTEDR
jgi:hypothetical protein